MSQKPREMLALLNTVPNPCLTAKQRVMSKAFKKSSRNKLTNLGILNQFLLDLEIKTKIFESLELPYIFNSRNCMTKPFL